jgi:pseudaminic acid synthase
MSVMRIGERIVGGDAPVYVIAELSGNHGGDFERARRLVHAAADAGADAVKLQTYTPDTMTIRSDAEHFRISSGTIWDGRTLYDLFDEAQTPWEWHEPLRREAISRGLDFFSSPFDATAVDFLETLAVPVYKVASFELVDIPLIRRIAQTGKPIILSTGMATREEIAEAVREALAGGANGVAVLACTSAYPAQPDEANLRSIPDLASTFGIPVGLSDHTLGVAVPIAAAALGAAIVEKHLTLSRSDPGPDSAFSLEPDEFAEMVAGIRTAQSALGEVKLGPTAHEVGPRTRRRSLFVVQDVRAGELYTAENVRSIRPGHGLHPRHLDDVLGRPAARDVAGGTPLAWELIASGRDEEAG